MTPEQKRIGERFLADRLSMSFEWGKNDCGLFVADFLIHTHGFDFLSKFRGKYDDEEGAQKILENYGGSIRGIFEEVAQNHGWKQKAGKSARWGDVGIVRLRDRESASICVGSRLLATGKRRIVSLPMTKNNIAWEVKRCRL